MKNRLYGLLALLAGTLLLGTGCSDDESGRTLRKLDILNKKSNRGTLYHLVRIEE